MKVENDTSAGLLIKDLERGDTFTYAGRVFMKVAPDSCPAILKNHPNVEIHAVCLNTGVLNNFDNTSIVKQEYKAVKC